ncbi:MAG: hypothetical protein LUG55_10975 [Clostridiales bacterium]|nr:hypothetical protein [Clostridiales bacterium]
MATPRLEILCATMGQTDFSKLQELKIQCDVLFANQADRFSYEELTWFGRWRCFWNGYRRFPALQSYADWAAEQSETGLRHEG